MKTVLLSFVVLLFFGCSASRIKPTKLHNLPNTKKQNFLKLHTKGHSDLITDIIVTNDKKIITSSDDKSICVWNLEGVEERQILGEIGAGSAGMIYAIALSPNQKWLAVGGFMEYNANHSDPKEANYIRLYNYQTGKLHRLLKGHTDAVHDLAFGKNSRYLISGSADRSVKVWDMESFSLHQSIDFHTSDVYAVKLLSTEDGYYALSAGFDNYLALHDAYARLIASKKLPHKLHSLALNDKHIAVAGFANEIGIYEHNLSFVQTIETNATPSSLLYKGNYLLAGSTAYPYEVRLYDDAYRLYQRFSGHDNLVRAVAFLDDKRIVSAGGNNKAIYVWDINTTSLLQSIEGVGEIIWDIALRNNTIAWSNQPNQPANKSIDLNTMLIYENANSYPPLPTSYQNYSLVHGKGGEYGLSDALLYIKENNQTKAVITKNTRNGLGHNVYGFYKNLIVSGGSNGALRLYNLEGKEVAKLIGHTGEI